MSKSLKIGIRQLRRAIKELVREKWIQRTDVKGVGVKLEATIDRARPLTDKTGVTPVQLDRSPLSDRINVPLTDRTDKGYTCKDIPKGKEISFVGGLRKTNKNNKGATEYSW